MKVIRCALVLTMAVLVTACASPKYSGANISPEVLAVKPKITVVEDADTRQGFLDTIGQWLTQKGYNYEVVSDNTKHDLNNLTLEYVGHWRWDLALFLSQAKIEAFHQGQRVGEVEYKAANNFNTNKFSDADKRIEYMLEVLFGNMSADSATQAIK